MERTQKNNINMDEPSTKLLFKFHAPRIIKGMMRAHGLGVTCGYIKVFGLHVHVAVSSLTLNSTWEKTRRAGMLYTMENAAIKAVTGPEDRSEVLLFHPSPAGFQGSTFKVVYAPPESYYNQPQVHVNCLGYCYSWFVLVTIRGNELVIFPRIALCSDDKYIFTYTLYSIKVISQLY